MVIIFVLFLQYVAISPFSPFSFHFLSFSLCPFLSLFSFLYLPHFPFLSSTLFTFPCLSFLVLDSYLCNLSFPFFSFPFLSFPFLSSRLSDECVQSGRAGSMQSIWLAGGGCHYSPVCIDTKRERIKDFKHAYLAMSLTAMFLVCFFSSSSSSSSPAPPSLLLISDAASQFNGHYDQIPGRDRGGSE